MHIKIFKRKDKKSTSKTGVLWKKEKEKKEANEQCRLSNNCENIIRIC